MKFSRWQGTAAALALLASLCAPSWVMAQTGTGTIDGRVHDESRASLPGATVTAKNVATGLTRSATVSGTGTYRVSALPAGAYDVTATLTGFSSQLTKAVEVRIGESATVDFSMKVGAVSETVEVLGETPLVQSTTSDVGQVITQKMVENIPLNGRKFQDLSLLVPGTRPSNYYDPTKTEVGGISYGGATGRSVIINVDGGDNNDGVVRGLLQQFSADAIQEYKVTTQRYSAEYGRSMGGVVNVITKSGTNDFHGGAVRVRAQRVAERAHLLRGADGRREARLQPAAVRRHAGRADLARTRPTSSCPTSATAATRPLPSSRTASCPTRKARSRSPSATTC